MNSRIEALDELNNLEYKKKRKNGSRKSRFFGRLTYSFELIFDMGFYINPDFLLKVSLLD